MDEKRVVGLIWRMGNLTQEEVDQLNDVAEIEAADMYLFSACGDCPYPEGPSAVDSTMAKILGLTPAEFDEFQNHRLTVIAAHEPLLTGLMFIQYGFMTWEEFTKQCDPEIRAASMAYINRQMREAAEAWEAQDAQIH